MSQIIELNEAYKARLVKEWAPVINVKNDIKDGSMRVALAQVLENTYKDLCRGGHDVKKLIKEAVFDNAVDTNLRNGVDNAISATQQDWKAGDVRIPLAVLPLARRMFTQLIAHDLVGVQAMASPSGYAAAFRYVYASGDNSGDEIVWDSFNPAFSGTTADFPADPKSEAGTSLDATEDSDTLATLEAFGLTATTTDDGITLSKASGVDVATGENMTFATPDTDAGETAIPRVAMKLEKVLVEAKTRKIGTSISMEDAEDALVSLGLDVNEAMVNILATDLKNEIDRELLQSIALACAGTKERAANGVTTWDAASADGLDQLGRLSHLYTHILTMSKRIQYRTKMGNGANWLVSSSPVTALIERIGDWKLADNDVAVDGAAIAYAGTLRRGSIKVYSDALTMTPYILLGWKGNDPTQCGVIYCPYIPAQILSGPDVDKFGSRLMARARYAIVNNIFGTELYYQLINLTNISSASAIVSGGTGAKVFATI